MGQAAKTAQKISTQMEEHGMLNGIGKLLFLLTITLSFATLNKYDRLQTIPIKTGTTIPKSLLLGNSLTLTNAKQIGCLQKPRVCLCG